MAGHRRAAGKPLQHNSKAAHRRRRLTDALARAQTPVERVTAAAAYARAAIASLARRDPRAADAVASELVAALTSIADQGVRRDRP